jgi:hypothetical protein
MEEEKKEISLIEFDMWCFKIKEAAVEWLSGDHERCPSCVIREMLESFGLIVEK